MKIAVLCTDQGVRIPGTKGASLHLLAITRAFAQLGHEVLLVGVEGRGPAPINLRCLRFAHPGRAEGVERENNKLQLVERIVADATTTLTEFGPDVIYERLSLFGTAGRRLAERVSALHVIEINALLAEEEVRWRGLHYIEEAVRREAEVLDAADVRVCVSAEIAARVDDLAPGPRTVVVPNGVDTDLFAQLPSRADARRDLSLPVDVPLIGFLGSLRPWHGLDVALNAMASLPDASLVIAGDGPIRTELERTAACLGISDRVHWLDNVAHDLVPAFLAGIDVAIAPYPPLDGFAFSPLKLFEYLAAGVPIVASDVGQVRVILDGGRWGRLVEPGDHLALAAGIQGVLDNPQQAGLRATAARHVARTTHDWTARAADIVAEIELVSASTEFRL